MIKEIRKYINGKYITEMVEIEEIEPIPAEPTETERIQKLEERQDISEAALEEFITMMLGGE